MCFYRNWLLICVGVDEVASLVGAQALAAQNRYVDGAVQAGMKPFIPSEFNRDTYTSSIFVRSFR